MPSCENRTVENIDQALTAMHQRVYLAALGPPTKHYYPVNSHMWHALLEWYTEERLSEMGIVKTDYLEVL